MVLGVCDGENSKTTNICLDKSYKLRISGPYDIEENNTIRVMMSTDESCGGTLIQKEVNGHESSLYEFQIVYCELKDVKPEVSLEKLDDFVVDSGCCDRLCIWCKNLCH